MTPRRDGIAASPEEEESGNYERRAQAEPASVAVKANVGGTLSLPVIMSGWKQIAVGVVGVAAVAVAAYKAGQKAAVPVRKYPARRAPARRAPARRRTRRSAQKRKAAPKAKK